MSFCEENVKLRICKQSKNFKVVRKKSSCVFYLNSKPPKYTLPRKINNFLILKYNRPIREDIRFLIQEITI